MSLFSLAIRMSREPGILLLGKTPHLSESSITDAGFSHRFIEIDLAFVYRHASSVHRNIDRQNTETLKCEGIKRRAYEDTINRIGAITVCLGLR